MALWHGGPWRRRNARCPRRVPSATSSWLNMALRPGRRCGTPVGLLVGSVGLLGAATAAADPGRVAGAVHRSACWSARWACSARPLQRLTPAGSPGRVDGVVRGEPRNRGPRRSRRDPGPATSPVASTELSAASRETEVRGDRVGIQAQRRARSRRRCRRASGRDRADSGGRRAGPARSGRERWPDVDGHRDVIGPIVVVGVQVQQDPVENDGRMSTGPRQYDLGRAAQPGPGLRPAQRTAEQPSRRLDSTI